ncbi:Pre-mRNA-splicing factor [Alternaria arborescens]|uniref:Pre-mRNA-splicing factor PRP46 n=1 Tax=Alternaria arborescens TaxID=156630 RepID=A0A4Q4S0P0_9PLEO|nr:Pre-mRNA-splicing factor [Alternaria arborescens]RYN28491.1 Pre-mRNA-splicing factor [Alternaria arborescens]RYO26598.1 Pre-mRNA-splicing factor [Alternaria arborescens]RYO63281.1 Pre-mRNA-splicing factor [Alternaria arborescens]
MAETAASRPQSTAEQLIRTSSKRTREIFAADFASPAALDHASNGSFSIHPTTPAPLAAAEQASVASRIRNEYEHVRELPPALAAKMASAASTAAERRKKIKAQNAEEKASDPKMQRMIDGVAEKADKARDAQSMQLAVRAGGKGAAPNAQGPTPNRDQTSSALVRKDVVRQAKPDWHAPWKVKTVISGHMGWVRSVAMEPGNQWFATGAADRTIKLWDLASGQLKITLTGHISAVRGLAVSPRHPYLFSCGEDKMVKCWDLETNKVIRHYHGHLSGVYSLSLHPTVDVLCTGGRDGVVRVWDMRSRSNIHVLGGHKGTISSIQCQEAEPQVISGSMDSTIRLWDLVAGKTRTVLTHHKKSVRSLATHPTEFTFASGSAQSAKQWLCPEGNFMQNFSPVNSIINTLSVNEDNIMFAGSDNGEASFYDWKTGHRFQHTESIAQPGSLEAEAGVMCSTFDKTGLRLITGESDKSIKIWKQDENATEETHPLDWKPTLGRRKF